MQLFTSYSLLLMIMLVTYIPSRSAQAIPLINTTSLANLNNTSGTVSMGIRFPLNPSKNESANESCEEEREMLKTFICSTINSPNNSTVIYSNASDIGALLNKLECEDRITTEAPTSEPEHNLWEQSVRIWTLANLRIFILLEAAINIKPDARKQIAYIDLH